MTDTPEAPREGSLFLGGPWHGSRVVVPDTFPITVPVVQAAVWSAEPEELPVGPEVTYTRRRAPFSSVRVLVAPDYRFDTPEWFVCWVRTLLTRMDLRGGSRRGPGG